jgi:hypothetical protein
MKKVKTSSKSQWSAMNFPKITDIVIGDEYKFVISVQDHSFTVAGKVKCISKLGGIVLKDVVLTNSSIKTTHHLTEFIFMFTDVSAIYKHKEGNNMDTNEIPIYPERIGDDEPTYGEDHHIRGIVCTRKQYYFDPAKVIEGYPYRIIFQEDTEIFDEKYKAGESIICLVSEALEEQINCVYVNREKSVQRFTLVPSMKFEIEWLI